MDNKRVRFGGTVSVDFTELKTGGANGSACNFLSGYASTLERKRSNRLHSSAVKSSS